MKYFKTFISLFSFIGFTSALESIDELCENYSVGTRIPHPEDCNLYLKCVRDNDITFAMVISCQNGVYFNPNTLECDPDYESAICKKSSTITSKPTKTKKTKKTRMTTKLPTEKSTTTNAEKKTKTTSEIEIETATTTIDIESETTLEPNIIECPEEDDAKIKFLRSFTDCSKYYMCYHGRALPLKCWKGLHFSSKLKKCVPTEIAKCEINDIPYPGCPRFGKTFIAHPNECRYFFYCFNGLRTIQQCGSFDYWDIIDRKCKRKTKAICYSEHQNTK